MESTGNRIKQLRLAKRMSQAELGDVVGVTRAAVSEWEKDTATPRFDKLNDLARFFGVSVSHFSSETADAPSVDAELKALPPDLQAALRQSFIATIKGLKPLK